MDHRNKLFFSYRTIGISIIGPADEEIMAYRTLDSKLELLDILKTIGWAALIFT
jgi:hypothetical protein